MIQILNGATTSLNVQATLTVDQLAFTAVPVGALGNNISIAYVKNIVPVQGTFAVVTSTVASGKVITVYLAVDDSNTITATATQVAAAIANNTSAATLVTTVISGGGSNLQVVTAVTPLVGGITGVYQRQGNTLIGLQFLSGFTGTTITFKGSLDGVHYGTVYDDAGAAVSVTVPAYAQYMIVTFPQLVYDAVGKLPYLQLVCGSSQSGNHNISPVVSIG